MNENSTRRLYSKKIAPLSVYGGLLFRKTFYSSISYLFSLSLISPDNNRLFLSRLRLPGRLNCVVFSMLLIISFNIISPNAHATTAKSSVASLPSDQLTQSEQPLSLDLSPLDFTSMSAGAVTLSSTYFLSSSPALSPKLPWFLKKISSFLFPGMRRVLLPVFVSAAAATYATMRALSWDKSLWDSDLITEEFLSPGGLLAVSSSDPGEERIFAANSLFLEGDRVSQEIEPEPRQIPLFIKEREEAFEDAMEPVIKKQSSQGDQGAITLSAQDLREMDADNLMYMRNMIEKHSDAETFFNAPYATELLRIPFAVNTEEVRSTLATLKHAEGEGILSQKALKFWSEKTLRNFLATEITSALEAYLLLSKFQVPQDLAMTELAEIFSMDVTKLLLVKKNLFKNMADYHQRYHNNPFAKLSKDADDKKVLDVVRTLSSKQVRKYLEPKVKLYGSYIYSSQQWPLIQAKHLVDFALTDIGIKKIFIAHIFALRGFKNFNIKHHRAADIHRIMTSQLYRFHEYLSEKKVLLPSSIGAYFQQELDEAERDNKERLMSSFLAAPTLGFAKNSKMLSGYNLQKKDATDFLEAIADHPKIEALFISQLMSQSDGFLEKFSNDYNVSYDESSNLQQELTVVFLNFLDARMSKKKSLLSDEHSKQLTSIDHENRFAQTLLMDALKVKMQEMTPHNMLRRLYKVVAADLAISIGYDYALDSTRFHDFLGIATKTPLLERVFMSRLLHLDGATLQRIAFIHQVPLEKVKNVEAGLWKLVKVLIFGNNNLFEVTLDQSPDRKLSNYFASDDMIQVYSQYSASDFLEIIGKSKFEEKYFLSSSRHFNEKNYLLFEQHVLTDSFKQHLFLKHLNLGGDISLENMEVLYGKSQDSVIHTNSIIGLSLGYILLTGQLTPDPEKTGLRTYRNKLNDLLNQFFDDHQRKEPKPFDKIEKRKLFSDHKWQNFELRQQRYEDLSMREVNQRLKSWYFIQSRHLKRPSLTWNHKVIQGLYDFTSHVLKDNVHQDIFMHWMLDESILDEELEMLWQLTPAEIAAAKKYVEIKLEHFIVQRLGSKAQRSERYATLDLTLLQYPHHLVQKWLQASLDLTDEYILESKQLKFFEKDFLQNDALLWQIYIVYFSEAKLAAGTENVIENYHEAVIDDLKRKMKVALTRTFHQVPMQKIYLNSLVDIIYHLKQPTSLDATLELGDLLEYYALFSENHMLRRLLVQISPEFSFDLKKTALLKGDLEEVEVDLRSKQELREFIENEVFSNALHLRIYLSLIMKLDQTSFIAVSEKNNVSAKEVKIKQQYLEERLREIMTVEIDGKSRG
ncbi:MAG: hypothetical protein OXC40_02425 [Proteobacteria bacterium]|nr:hypothetical protein [Pseudomonadota bacterium]